MRVRWGEGPKPGGFSYANCGLILALAMVSWSGTGAGLPRKGPIERDLRRDVPNGLRPLTRRLLVSSHKTNVGKVCSKEFSNGYNVPVDDEANQHLARQQRKGFETAMLTTDEPLCLTLKENRRC